MSQKLTRALIRKLIVEMSPDRQGQQPAWADEWDNDIATFVYDTMGQTWKSLYSDIDPSMVSQEDWNRQVDIALEQLESSIGQVVTDIEHQLIEGEFGH